MCAYNCEYFGIFWEIMRNDIYYSSCANLNPWKPYLKFIKQQGMHIELAGTHALRNSVYTLNKTDRENLKKKHYYSREHETNTKT